MTVERTVSVLVSEIVTVIVPATGNIHVGMHIEVAHVIAIAVEVAHVIAIAVVEIAIAGVERRLHDCNRGR